MQPEFPIAQPATHKTPFQLSLTAAKANQQFSFKLFRQLCRSNVAENVVISAFSVGMAFAMLESGASGKTQQAIATVLEFLDLHPQDVNRAYAFLLETLLRSDHPEVQLAIANFIWVKETIPLHPEFIQQCQAVYDADIQAIDFSNPTAIGMINAWVRQKTNNKIHTIVSKINPETLLILINAIYFKGKWQILFDRALTKDRSFHLLDGRQKQHPMMTQSGSYAYQENDLFQAIRLSYGESKVDQSATFLNQRKPLSFYVFLPKPGIDWQQFHGNLTAANWQRWMNRFQMKKGTIVLPRFGLEYGVTLKSVLEALGLGVAFDAEQADFSPISPSPLVIRLNRK